MQMGETGKRLNKIIVIFGGALFEGKVTHFSNKNQWKNNVIFEEFILNVMVKDLSIRKCRFTILISQITLKIHF